MLFDEPTNSLDPIVAGQVLDLLIRARDINKISSIYVTKKPFEIPYLTMFLARVSNEGEIVIGEAPKEKLPRTRIMVLDSGAVAFVGSPAEFEQSDYPSVKRMLTLEHHEHLADPYFLDPWDRARAPEEKFL